MSTDTILDLLFWTAIVAGVVGGAIKRESSIQQPLMFWIIAFSALVVTTSLWIMWGNATGNWDVARIPLASIVATFIGSVIGVVNREIQK